MFVDNSTFSYHLKKLLVDVF